jgi:hypothetical protein
MLRPFHRRPRILLPGSLLSKFSSTSSASPPPPPPLTDLRATAPSHNALILLRSAYPPPTFPARGPESQVSRQLQVGAVKWGGLVNWVWDRASEHKDTEVGKESYRATVFSKYGRLEVPRVSLDNVDVVGKEMQRFACDGVGDREKEKRARDETVHLLVCTHTARDCRCGVLGGAFVQALREAVERVRNVKIKIKIGEVAHVGGHKCVLLFSQFVSLTLWSVVVLTGTHPISSSILTEIGMVFCPLRKFLKS